MKKLCFLILIATCIGCNKYDADESVDREEFPNVLNIKNVPKAALDWDSFCHSDLGSWFGFALPRKSDSKYLGSFTGPFIITNGKWLSKSILNFNLIVNNEVVDFKNAKNIKLDYLPGILQQKFTANEFQIESKLIFISNEDALIKTSITNKSNQEKTISCLWNSTIFNQYFKLPQQEDSKVKIKIKNSKKYILVNTDSNKLSMGNNDSSFVFENKNITIRPNEIKDFNFTVSLILDGSEKENEELIKDTFINTEGYYSENRQRWNDYLNKALSQESRWNTTENRNIAVKSIITLLNNWKSANGDILHDGLFPSYAIWYFNGFWAWDSWKHSVALANFIPELAKNQIRTMFDYQNEKGMVADCIYENKEYNNWLNTKPPLASWAVWKVFKKTDDKSLLSELYPKLTKYHYWWYEYRDIDSNGICEYGSPVDSLIAAKWESGMDNAVRFDGRKLIKSNSGEYSIDMESVDLNSYLYYDKVMLSNVAEKLGYVEDKTRFLNEAKDLKKRINDIFFNKSNGYFYDVDLITKEHILVEGPEGWIPLWTKVADNAKAAKVEKVILEKFNTYIPLPTLASDHPKFTTDGYWRGPNWLDQVYFGIKGLENYMFENTATDFTKRVFNDLEGLKTKDSPIRENYNPLNGKGLEANHFSWSAAHLLLLYLDE